jgi:hypothetical protein
VGENEAASDIIKPLARRMVFSGRKLSPKQDSAVSVTEQLMKAKNKDFQGVKFT